MPRSNVTRSSRQKGEDGLRLMAFHVAYSTIYAGTSDLTLRFALSLLYSTQPIRNRAMVDAMSDWLGERFSCNPIAALLKAGKPCPDALKPVVDAWRASVAKDEHWQKFMDETKDGRGRGRSEPVE